jgi:hypothetical protein
MRRLNYSIVFANDDRGEFGFGFGLGFCRVCLHLCQVEKSRTVEPRPMRYILSSPYHSLESYSLGSHPLGSHPGGAVPCTPAFEVLA